jgi:hypothetical protein
MSWHETPDGDCAFCQTLYRDDGKALGYILRFYAEGCSTYAYTATRRMGACSSERRGGTLRRRAGLRGGRF